MHDMTKVRSSCMRVIHTLAEHPGHYTTIYSNTCRRFELQRSGIEAIAVAFKNVSFLASNSRRYCWYLLLHRHIRTHYSGQKMHRAYPVG